MTTPKNAKTIESIKAAVLTDILETPDQEVIQEAETYGFSIQDLHTLKSSMRDHAASLVRSAMLAPKITLPTGRFHSSRPPLTVVRARIDAAMQDRAAVRFRDAKQQTEEDIYSLYDDLVELGIIKQGEDEN